MNDSPNWIATRTLTKVGHPDVRIEVNIGIPEQVSDQEWRCGYRMTSEEDNVRYAHGLDSVRSLMLALVAIRAHFDASKDSYTWVSGNPGDVGFPMSVPTHLGFDFSHKMEHMLTSETEKFVSTLQERSGQ